MSFEYLRSEKKNTLEKMKALPLHESLKVVDVQDGVVFPLKKVSNFPCMFGSAGVLTKNGNYVELSGIEKRIEGSYPVQNPVQMNKTVVYCGYFVKQWGHYLIESVARLWIALEKRSDIDNYVFTVDSDSETRIDGNYWEFLELLGISDKVLVINQPTRFSKVIVPELGYSRNRFYSNKYLNIFDEVSKKAELRLGQQKMSEQKIYLSRSKFKKARNSESGIELLDHYFAKNGFELVYPETIQLDELICRIRKASLIGVESGTAQHNLLFSKDKQKTIVIERHPFVNEIQTQVNQMKRLQTNFIDAHYSFYPVAAGCGPFFLGYTEQLQRFTRDNDYIDPDLDFLSEKYIRNCLKKYLKAYKMSYHYQWGLEEWQLSSINLYHETYIEARKKMSVYLNGEKPVFYYDFLNVKFLKELIYKLKSSLESCK